MEDPARGTSLETMGATVSSRCGVTSCCGDGHGDGGTGDHGVRSSVEGGPGGLGDIGDRKVACRQREGVVRISKVRADRTRD